MDMRVLEQTFALFDKNNSKRISVKDMGDFLRLMGEDVSEEEVRDMIRGVSGEDGISFEQFARFMQEEDENEKLEKEPEKKKKSVKKKTSDSVKSPRTITRKRSKSTVTTTSSKIMNFLSPRSKKSTEKTSERKTPRKHSNSITSNTETAHERSIEEMHRAFQAFDLNGDGKVTTHEVGIMMRRFGLGSQEQSIQNLFDLLGPSDQGKKTEEIDFAQFLKLTNMV